MSLAGNYIWHPLHLAAVLHPPLRRIRDDEDLLAPRDRLAQ